ncbi:rhodanese-related sulfurtransferase [Microbacterium sp. MPKO10]|uniref:oxygen-dependent tRNA uridine(34) hydroxylase TrhO n=1 Tax=Microbacterium sp. MPKO10 TaxID=2989818 RepID=UPI00223675E6|nr:rhodanese-related sulfurtransferase [Microbacterium sp. MPKO10]MCW4457078.1 rhodanese-related sulfurtransferase [Microbacterium sp. MPKO10]
MAIPKILLYYVFTPLADPDAIRLWQRDLCASLNLRGRILISKDGINGTVGGELDNVKRYLRTTREYAAFADMDVKWSQGTGLDDDGASLDFPKLSVKVRDEIVSFGAPDELEVDASGVIGGGTHVTPEQVNELVAARGDEVVFFDGRNAFEAAIGRFKNAVVPNVDNTRDFVEVLDSGAYDHLKDKPIVTYCTGGIRCEVLSSLMRSRGFDEVYQIDGGIVRYGEQFGDDGLWEGSLYVFDKRMSLEFSDHAAVIGECAVCTAKTSHMQNCADPSCRTQLVVCDVHAASAPFCLVHDDHSS